jgi:hypothetical protein
MGGIALNMIARLLICAACAALAACDSAPPAVEQSAAGPALDAPTQEADSARAYAPANPAATALTGALQARFATRMPEAGEAENGAPPQDVLSISGATGYTLDADLTGAASPAVQVEEQTLRALLALPVDVSQTLVYRVVRETKTAGGQGLCGADDAAFLIVWESPDTAEPVLKLLGLAEAAPGEPRAHACAMLEYSRP